MGDKDISFVIRLAAGAAAYIVCAMVTVMLIGLFDPMVDNKEIFKTISPAFQTMVGCFAGVIGTVIAMKKGSGP